MENPSDSPIIPALLVTIDRSTPHFQDDIDELSFLCKTLNIEIKDSFIQKRNKEDLNYFVGKGKIQEIASYLKDNKDVKTVVFNSQLSNIQRKNIEKILNVNILDRTEIILEIFRLHARTAQSKLQVEIAKLQYELPKLIGKGKYLSRTGGGIGTLGPGETALEYDRRFIRKRISVLKKKLKKIEESQKLFLSKSANKDILRISFTGYTSAGKSTLLKALSGDKKILVSDKLFSTLSTLSRRVLLPSGLNAIFSDTVGFIRALPVQLVESFKSTLAHINYSDLIVVITDISDEDYIEKMNSVRRILNDIVSSDIPKLFVFNKIDKISEDMLQIYRKMYPDSYFLSAISSNSVKRFISFIENYLLENGILESRKLHLKPEERAFVDTFRGKIGVLSADDLGNVNVVGKRGTISRLISNINRM